MTIQGYDCAAISKNGGPGKLCANTLVEGLGGEEECTETPYGSVTVCGRPEPSPAGDIYSSRAPLQSAPFPNRRAIPHGSDLRH